MHLQVHYMQNQIHYLLEIPVVLQPCFHPVNMIDKDQEKINSTKNEIQPLAGLDEITL
jgi:hypothetical protein